MRADQIVGYRVCFGGNHGKEVECPGVVIYLVKNSFDEPIEGIRAVEIDMTGAKLFSFFKRFDCVFTQKGKSFEGIEVEGPYSV